MINNVIAGIIISIAEGFVIFFLIWYFIKQEKETQKDKLIEQIKAIHETELKSRNEMIEQWKEE